MKRMSKSDLFFFGVLILSLSLNVYLGVRAQSRESADPPSLPLGSSVPPIEAIDAAGKREILTFSGVDRPTVLYIIKPSCEWCTRNMPSVKTLAATRSSNYRFVGLSLTAEGLREYVERQRFNFPVYAIADEALARSLKLGVTPQTLLIAQNAKVMGVWTGAYNGNLKREIERTFNVRLPEVGDPAPASTLLKRCTERGQAYDHGFLMEIQGVPMRCDGRTGKWVPAKGDN